MKLTGFAWDSLKDAVGQDKFFYDMHSEKGVYCAGERAFQRGYAEVVVKRKYKFEFYMTVYETMKPA